MKQLLLTGSTGMIGTHLLKFLATQKDIEVVAIRDSIPDMEFDYIVHAAGYGQPVKFLQDEIGTIRVNTTMLMELLTRLKPDGRFLYMSSSEVYSGASSPHYETQIGTTNPTHPRACYIESKRCGEAICMAYRRMGYDIKIARLSLAYGATKKGDTRALSRFIEQGIETKKIKLMDKGEAQRTYLYVEDAVDMLWHILTRGQSDIYNVGGTSKTTIADLARKIADLTGSTITFGNQGLVGAPDGVELDMSKYQDEFGPYHFTTLEEGLQKTINDYAT